GQARALQGPPRSDAGLRRGGAGQPVRSRAPALELEHRRHGRLRRVDGHAARSVGRERAARPPVGADRRRGLSTGPRARGSRGPVPCLAWRLRRCRHSLARHGAGTARESMLLARLLLCTVATATSTDYQADVRFAIEELEKSCAALLSSKKIDWKAAS